MERIDVAACRLGRVVGSIDEEGDVVGEKEREEQACGLVSEDAFPSVVGGKCAGMSDAFIWFISFPPSVLFSLK